MTKVIEDLGLAGGFETLSSITSAVGFTSEKIAPTSGLFEGKKAQAALISVEDADIRFTLDGTTPTRLLQQGFSRRKLPQLNLLSSQTSPSTEVGQFH